MKRLLVAIFAMVISTSFVQAQAIQNIVLRNSFTPFGAGARGVGMGGAFIAVADDGTAATFNPAGLAQLRRSEFAFVLFRNELESTMTLNTPTGVETRVSAERHTAPHFLGLAIPFEIAERRLTVQVSYQRAIDLVGEGTAVVPLRDPDLYSEVFTTIDIAPEQSGAFHTISGAAAYQITSRLSLGASFNYWIGEWTAEGSRTVQTFDRGAQGTAPEELTREETQFEQEQSLRAVNVNAGFLLKYPRLSIGGVVRLPFAGNYDLGETTSTTATDSDGTSIEEFSDLSLTSRLHWPRGAGIGVALRPLPGLTVSVDFTTSLWSRTYIEEVPDGALLTAEADEGETTSFTDRNFFDLRSKSVTTTKNSSQWRAGVEYLWVLPKVVVPLRGGLFRERSPFSDPLDNEGRRIEGFTIGTGLNFNRFVFDVAFERRESEGTIGLRGSGGTGTSTEDPTEFVTQNRLVASFIYRFEDDDPLKQLFRSLFTGSEETHN